MYIEMDRENGSKREHWHNIQKQLTTIWFHCITKTIRNYLWMTWLSQNNAHRLHLSSFLTSHASSYRASTSRPRGGTRTTRRELGCSEGRCRSTVPRMGFWAGHSVARIRWRLVASTACSPYRGTLVHLQVSWWTWYEIIRRMRGKNICHLFNKNVYWMMGRNAKRAI